MKRSILKLAALAALLIGSTAFAEGNGAAANMKANVLTQEVGAAPDVNATISALGVRTADYEAQIDATTMALNAASTEVASLFSMSHSVNMQASSINNIERMAPVASSILDNLDSFFARLVKSSPRYEKDRSKANDLRERLYAYNFGPARIGTVDISQVSNEGKGVVKVGTREIRYVSTSGLTATKQNEREVIAVERLSDGEYKVAIGIFYAGQENASLKWDERTYTRLDWFLEYHNVNADGQNYLKCGKSKCVPFSDNKSVNAK